MNSPAHLVKAAVWHTLLLCFCLLLLGVPAFLHAQDFDYRAHPNFSVDYTGLAIELGIQPQNMKIDGAATYQFEAKKDSVTSISLSAQDMEIQFVLVDEQEVDFEFEEDSLIVQLPFQAQKGEEHSLRIRYSGAPGFGLLKDRHNSVWTSMLPLARSHWVPMVEHPQVRLKPSFTITLPAEYQVWATGRKTGQEAVSDGIMQYRFTSEKNIPASEIGFTLGHFINDSTIYQDKKINLAVEQSLSDSVDQPRLLRQAKDWLARIEKETEADYPFDNLTIITLEDHNWETKSWGASTVYLYKNRGNLEHQLLRGLTGQWASARSLPVKWQQADAITLYQTLLHQSITGERADLRVTDQPQPSFDTIYEQFGPARWNSWQEQWQQWKGTRDGLFANIPPPVLQQFLLMTSSADYLKYWDKQPVFELPPAESSSEPAQAPLDVHPTEYKVDYQYEEAAGNLTLTFEARQGRYDEPVVLQLHKAYGNNTDQTEVAFSGSNDSVVVSVDPGLQSAWFTIPNNLNLNLDEDKPVSFLLYELKNAKTVEQRARAARNLGNHTQNPDIQLAVNDALSRDTEPAVRAGLLTSLADITDGAAGTEQIFVEALQNKEKAVQRAGLYGLQNYPEDAEVRRRIRNLAANVQDSTLFGEALTAFAGFASDEELQNFLPEIIRRDSTGRRAITAVKYLSAAGEDSVLATDLLSPFLDAEHSYVVRRRALQTLMDYDMSPESWLARGEDALETSPDPRIRYLVVQGMLKNSSTDVQSFLKDYLPTEADARVHLLIENAMNRNDS